MLRRALSLATALVFLTTSGVAVAQDATQTPAAPAAPAAAPATTVVSEAPAAAPAAKEEEKTEEIVVTGTRIRRKDLTTPAPVTVINREQIVASGKVSIGDFLQTLPEQGNAINTQYNNGGDGSTRVALRSLGSTRTLVLINGRRMVPGGTGTDASVDLNSIPSQAIERVEILKDGASAVYGSDAIAGVVNLITRKGYDGSSVAAYAGQTSQGDGTTYDVGVTAGTSSDRGTLLFSAGYTTQEEISAGDRDWSFYAVDWDYTSGEEFRAGSSAIPMGRVGIPRSCATAKCTALFAAYPGYTGSNWVVDPTHPTGFRPYAASDAYNFQPENLISTPQQRISLFTIGDTKLGDNARGFFEASYLNRESNIMIAPNPFFSLTAGGNGVVVSPNNLYNPLGIAVSDVRRRLVEVDNRMYRQNIDTFRIAGGLDGSLPEALGPLAGWFWETSLNYGRTNSIDTREGELRAPKIADAVGPSMLDPVSGDPICVSTPGDASTVIDGCVPLNLFGGAGTISKEAIETLGFVGTNRGWNQMFSFQANASGDLFKLMADRPVSLALGYEWRELTGEYVANPINAAGEGDGNNFKSTKGGYNVNELYGELSIPIVGNLPFAQEIEATLAARYFDYSTFGSDATYKIGARWTIIPDITLRGTYSTAFRAPTIPELYSGAADSFESAFDPCAGGAPGTPDEILPGDPLYAACGTAVNNQDDRTQVRTVQGGNPDLDPETAKIFTLGVVWEPRFVKNLSVALDYYSIDITDSITTVGTQTILDGCYPSEAGVTPRYCNQVTRDANGIVNVVDDRNTNVGGDETSGIDIAVRYAIPTGLGRFGFVFDGTWLQNFDEELPDGTIVNAVGNYDLSLALPKYKFNTGLTWGWKGFGAGFSTRFIGAFEECANVDGTGTSGKCYIEEPLAASEGRAPYKRDVKSWATSDAFVSYAIGSAFGKTNIALGVQNLFDANPRLVYAASSTYASSDPSTYDYMGRFVYLRLEHAY
jgi:outer membrane receptor protein involved in Fe transport